MNENQKFLLELYREFGDNAQKALDFVRKNEQEQDALISKMEIVQKKEERGNKRTTEVTPSTNKTRENGVYYLLNDGEIVPYGSFIFDTDVKMIAIFHNGHSFGVPLDGDLGKHSLLKSNKHPMDDFCVNECQALLDWDFVKNTEHIQELGTDIPLKDGQYLPTVPVWLAMYAYKDELNKALADFGGFPIDFSEDYWLAQRCNRSGVWYFLGTVGSYNLSNAKLSLSVRVVSPLV